MCSRLKSRMLRVFNLAVSVQLVIAATRDAK